MKEYKSVRIHYSQEVPTIELYEAFGWKIEDSRESSSQVSLRFSRDPAEMKNYAKVVEYEREYFSDPLQSIVPNVFGTNKTMTILTVTGILALILGIILLWKVSQVWIGLIPLVWVVAVIAMWIVHCLSASKAKKVRSENYRLVNEKTARNAQIVAESRALLY